MQIFLPCTIMIISSLKIMTSCTLSYSSPIIIKVTLVIIYLFTFSCIFFFGIKLYLIYFQISEILWSSTNCKMNVLKTMNV